MNVAHRRHSQQLAQRPEIFGGDWPQYLFVADEPRCLAERASDVEAVMKMNVVVAGLDLTSQLA